MYGSNQKELLHEKRGKTRFSRLLRFSVPAARDCRAFPSFFARHSILADRPVLPIENLAFGQKDPHPSSGPFSPVRPAIEPRQHPGIQTLVSVWLFFQSRRGVLPGLAHPCDGEPVADGKDHRFQPGIPGQGLVEPPNGLRG